MAPPLGGVRLVEHNRRGGETLAIEEDDLRPSFFGPRAVLTGGGGNVTFETRGDS